MSEIDNSKLHAQLHTLTNKIAVMNQLTSSILNENIDLKTALKLMDEQCAILKAKNDALTATNPIDTTVTGSAPKADEPDGS